MLSTLQRQKLTRYFRVYDVDEDGSIGRMDFERVLENLRVLHRLGQRSAGWSALREAYLKRWEGIRQSADVDEDGSVDLQEWLDYFDEVLGDDSRYQEEVSGLVDRLFGLFDYDESGRIDVDEFCNFYGCYGLKAQMAREAFHELDQDDDGVISRAELTRMAEQFYRSDHASAPGNLLYGPLDG